MKCILLLPYVDYYNTNFDVDDNYYSNGGYEEALKTNNDMYKDSIYNHISNNGLNANTAVFRNPYGFNKENNIFNEKVSKNEEKTQYTSCEAIIYDENMKNCDVQHIIKFLREKDVFVLYVKLDFNTIEEEFEEDFKMWVKSHVNINKTSASDEWKFENEPKRNIILNYENIKYNLINCMILEYTNDGFFMLVNEIKECNI